MGSLEILNLFLFTQDNPRSCVRFVEELDTNDKYVIATSLVTSKDEVPIKIVTAVSKKK